MQPQDFLAAVLPTEGNGYYCSADLLRKRHVFVATLAELIDTSTELHTLNEKKNPIHSKEAGSFYALATYEQPRSRKVVNVSHLRCVYVDIDCGGGDKCYTSKQEGWTALCKFMEVTGLAAHGVPWLVDSGGGIHAYITFQESLPLAVWLPVAKAFKATAARLGFRIDMTVSDDAARVLRVPGAFNYKLAAPREVKLRQEGTVFDLEAFKSCLDKPEEAAPKIPRSAVTVPPDALMQALTQNHPTYFKDIVSRTNNGKGCSQIGHYILNASQDGMEPLWRACLSIAQKCEDGDKACMILTRAHPYTEERMNEKLATILGPYSCEKFNEVNPGLCAKCPQHGRITNPLALGRRIMRAPIAESIKSSPPTTVEIADELVDDKLVSSLQAEANSEVVDIDESALYPNRPAAPYSFFYSATGGVYRSVNEYDKKGVIIDTREVEVLPYAFYMINAQQETDEFRARFMAVRGTDTTYVTVTTESISDPGATIKELARQNIIAANGKNNDVHLYAYVREQVMKASIHNKALYVPPRYGWQPDDSFAVGDVIIKPQQQGYTFVSNKLRNLINTTSVKGDLAGWKQYVQMIQDKRLYGVLAAMMVSFASPLMRWAGAGTPGMLFHGCHKYSGHGKTVAVHLAASVWGNPATYPVRPATSATTMMQRAGMLGCLPLLVDEITAVARKDKEFGPTLIYNYAQGGHKLKGSGAGNMELNDDLFWTAVGLITSNEPLMEKMLAARDTTSTGEVYRVLEWHPEETIVWSDAERLLIHGLMDNHGIAGRMYAEWLVDNQEKAQAVYKQITDWWRKHSKATDIERFWTVSVGACLAGAVLAGPGYANIFKFDTKELGREYLRWVSKARKLIGSNEQNSEDVLNAYTREYHGQFVRFDASKGPRAMFEDGSSPTQTSTRGKIAGRIECNIRQGYLDYYIDMATLKRYTNDRNVSYETLKTDLAKTLSVEEVRKDLLSKTGGPVLRVWCLHISRELSKEEALDTTGQVSLA